MMTTRAGVPQEAEPDLTGRLATTKAHRRPMDRPAPILAWGSIGGVGPAFASPRMTAGLDAGPRGNYRNFGKLTVGVA